MFDIEADGNINEETIILCHSSGANIFVSGGYVFGHNNPELRIKKLKNILSNGKRWIKEWFYEPTANKYI